MPERRIFRGPKALVGAGVLAAIGGWYIGVNTHEFLEEDDTDALKAGLAIGTVCEIGAFALSTRIPYSRILFPHIRREEAGIRDIVEEPKELNVDEEFSITEEREQ